MKQIQYAVLALVVLALAGCAQFGHVETPQSANESAAYAGATVQSVQQTAISQYPYMTEAQATEVHEQIERAVSLRKGVVQALLVGDDAQANTKLGQLQSVLAATQRMLNEYGAAQ